MDFISLLSTPSMAFDFSGPEEAGAAADAAAAPLAGDGAAIDGVEVDVASFGSLSAAPVLRERGRRRIGDSRSGSESQDREEGRF